jgi:hypothetical protein
MISLYYTFSFLFIWMNLFYLANITKIDIRVRENNTFSKIHLFYYFTKILYWIWIFLGLFLPTFLINSSIITMMIVKFISFHFSNKFYKLTNVIIPLLSSILIFSMFIYWIMC